MGKRKTIVIVAEGAHDCSLNKVNPTQVKDILSNRLHLDTRITTLGHVQRGGSPCAYDRYLSTLQGVEAVKAVLDATPETPTPVICVIENKIVRKPLMKAVEVTRAVAEAIKVKDFDLAMQLRGADFAEYHTAYMTTTATEQSEQRLPKEKVRAYPSCSDLANRSQQMRIGIIHVGAPAGGVNSATRAAVAYCLSRGHTPIALHNGFSGLCRHHDDQPLGSVRELRWLDVEGWVSKGGSEIGTNRNLPSEDMPKTAFCFEKYKIDALFIVGGFEAFTAVSELRKARAEYPAFRIPITLLPATISNNVPGTEYSIGSDTCLNTLVGFCDAIKQSASASRRRVFVIETQGGNSGYIATLAGLSVGALAVYTPEEGVSLKMLARDIEHLRATFAEDKGQSKGGKLILRNEKASKAYTTEVINDMINNEAHGRFESRSANPGHFQQGVTPSPMDRVRAVRLAVKCIASLEGFAGQSKDEIMADEMSASVIGVKGASVVFGAMARVESEETNWKERRPKDESWLLLKAVVDTLSGRPKAEETCETCGKRKGDVTGGTNTPLRDTRR